MSACMRIHEHEPLPNHSLYLPPQVRGELGSRIRIRCIFHPIAQSNTLDPTMHRTPNPSNIRIRTDHLPAPNLGHLRARIPHQVLGHVLDLLFLEVAHTDGLLTPVDVERPEHRVFRRPR
jgi:hypothetical protein